MASKVKDAPVLADFDSPEYDNQFEDGTRIHEVLESSITSSTVDLMSGNARRTVMQQAVEATISSALTTIDMLFMARDDAAVTPWSLVNGSWDSEPEPEPCSVDNWLRAAIPETQQPKQSYMLAEFLRGAQAPATGVRSSASMLRRNESKRVTQTGTSDASPPRAARGASPHAAQSPSRTSPSPARRKQLTPEQAAAEARLREELEIRRAQLAVLADLDAKDAAARARLTTISKELRGKDYSYDHKGQVVPLAQVDEGGPHHAHLTHGPTFAVRVPEVPGTGKQLRRGMSMAKKEAPKGAPGIISKGPADRKLTNDFRETLPKTQPNSLQVIAPAGGVTLRGGGTTKQGPGRAKQGLGMTREELDRYAASMSLSNTHQPTTSSAADLNHTQSLQPAAITSKGAPLRLQPLPTRSSATVDACAPTDPFAAAEANPMSAQQPGSRVPGTLDASLGPGSLRFSEGLLSHLPNSPSRLAGAKARQATVQPRKPSTPDVNPSLVSASDWGRSAGVPAGKHPALDTVKPSERDREMELGRNVRLPRDRATQATSSPPISPSKLQPHVPQPTFVHG